MFRCLHAGRWAPRPIDVGLAEVAHLVEVDLEEGDHEADLAVLRALLDALEEVPGLQNKDSG